MEDSYKPHMVDHSSPDVTWCWMRWSQLMLIFISVHHFEYTGPAMPGLRLPGTANLTSLTSTVVGKPFWTSDLWSFGASEMRWVNIFQPRNGFTVYLHVTSCPCQKFHSCHKVLGFTCEAVNFANEETNAASSYLSKGYLTQPLPVPAPHPHGGIVRRRSQGSTGLGGDDPQRAWTNTGVVRLATWDYCHQLLQPRHQ